jgi:hypothetical protein
MKQEGKEVVGIFDRMDGLGQTVKKLRQAGFADITVHSPVPCHELEEELDRVESPVRFFTLAGGFGGAIAGFILTIGASLQNPIMSGGKPIVSLPAFLIIAFELTILFGALATIGGMFWSMRRPRLKLEEYYDPQFSVDRFGVRVLCQKDNWDSVHGILSAAGAEEVRREEY